MSDYFYSLLTTIAYWIGEDMNRLSDITIEQLANLEDENNQ